MNFESLKLKSEIVKSLQECKIDTPTNIQESSIPLILSGKDIIGISKTGSGKTAAFSLPLLNNLDLNKGLQALVVVPTRELVVQIAKEIKKFSKNMKPSPKIATVFGGVAIAPQMKEISVSNIVIGTPGRLLDHLGRGTLNLSTLTSLVLDEADKMVEMGFIEDIEEIISNAPRNRQILLFGATISEEINYLKDTYMNSPQIVKSELHVEEDLLEQYYYDVDHREKFSLLIHLLKKEKTHRTIIFCSARSTVELVASNLRQQGIEAALIHGKLTQDKRLKVMDQFNKGRPHVLVASSVAARGLHINGVSHIINFDLSKEPQEYIHRIGRTARAGETGKAITLLSERDYGAFSNIESKYGSNILKLPNEDFPKIRFDTRRSGGRDNRRSNFRDRRNTRGPQSRTGSNRFSRSSNSRSSFSNSDSRNNRSSNNRRSGSSSSNSDSRNNRSSNNRRSGSSSSGRRDSSNRHSSKSRNRQY